MERQVRQFVLGKARFVLGDDIPDDLPGDTLLGPGGLDLDSLSLAEIAVLAEQEFGIQITEEELDGQAELTLDAFCALVAGRATTSSTGGAR